MNSRYQNRVQNASNQECDPIVVTVTHPHHPLLGQKFDFVRERKGEKHHHVVVRLRDGHTAYLPVDYTDYVSTRLSRPAPRGSSCASEERLLNVDGLLQMAKVIRGINERQEVKD